MGDKAVDIEETPSGARVRCLFCGTSWDFKDRGEARRWMHLHRDLHDR
jgi:hypothetical protein